MTYFYTGNIQEPSTDNETLIIEAMESGDIKITHTAVHAYENSEMALAITIIGDDIKIIEKQTPQAHYDSPTVDVVYYVECIYNRRYHLYFESQATGGYATTSVRNEVPFRSVNEFVK